MTPAAIAAASRRTEGICVRTPVARSDALDALAGARLFFKCEHLQRGGSFKLRGAANAVFSLPDHLAPKGVVTDSSGNFAIGIAMAARERGIQAHIVMPVSATRTKLEAVNALGAKIYPCEPTLEDRVRWREQVRAETGATFISSNDHPDVIAGQGTVGVELLEQVPALDAVIVPVGGGGLIAGIAVAVRGAGVRVLGAEPTGAAHAAACLEARERLPIPPASTIAEGLRVGLGELSWQIVRQEVERVLVVEDDAILQSMRLVRDELGMIVEASGAVSLAALLHAGAEFTTAETNVGVILSGGNVDLDRLPWTEPDPSLTTVPDPDLALAESPLAESPLAESPLAESPLAESPLADPLGSGHPRSPPPTPEEL